MPQSSPVSVPQSSDDLLIAIWKGTRTTSNPYPVYNFLSFHRLSHSYERRASGATTPGENASLQVRRMGVRRRNLCPGLGLPVAASHQVCPSSPSSRSSPLFFFSFLAVENGKLLLRCGVGERQSRDSSGNKKTTQPKTTFSFFPFFSSFFFFFSILAVENGQIQSSCVVGERRSQSRFVVGSSGKKKTSQPKTTSFWVGLIFFF